ncbi:MAG: hypothetical protein IJ207_13885 [Treponema sp.]|nr:hypothetical protein [Treponema sp.]MBQ9283264.1 hypothetical protein [Treponema sp.]
MTESEVVADLFLVFRKVSLSKSPPHAFETSPNIHYDLTNGTGEKA